MTEIEQAIELLQAKVAEIRRYAAKPHPAEDADFIATNVAEADAIDTLIAAVPPHDWRYDESAQVYRCWKCLVRGDRPHARTCSAAIPDSRISNAARDDEREGSTSHDLLPRPLRASEAHAPTAEPVRVLMDTIRAKNWRLQPSPGVGVGKPD